MLVGFLISSEIDGRPILLGLIWRKLVFRAIFALDETGIRERLKDQLPVR